MGGGQTQGERLWPFNYRDFGKESAKKGEIINMLAVCLLCVCFSSYLALSTHTHTGTLFLCTFKLARFVFSSPSQFTHTQGTVTSTHVDSKYAKSNLKFANKCAAPAVFARSVRSRKAPAVRSQSCQINAYAHLDIINANRDHAREVAKPHHCTTLGNSAISLRLIILSTSSSEPSQRSRC